jgi:REP element-mobilizing transposase RayT
MKFNPRKHHRRSIRLPDYDYSQPGAYFITIVTYQRDCLFGEIAHGQMKFSPMGQIAEEHWRLIPAHFPHVGLGAYVVMPNHVHGIIIIQENGMATKSSPSVRATQWVAPTPSVAPTPFVASTSNGPKRGSIGAIIGSYKMSVTRRVQREFNATGFWQRNYGACPECPSGRIEGNISSGMRQNTIGFTSISHPTSTTGKLTMSIGESV